MGAVGSSLKVVERAGDLLCQPVVDIVGDELSLLPLLSQFPKEAFLLRHQFRPRTALHRDGCFQDGDAPPCIGKLPFDLA